MYIVHNLLYHIAGASLKFKVGQHECPKPVSETELLLLLQAGLVKAAVDAAASAKIRRKRKQQEQQAAEAGAAPAATAAAAWANLKVQQRAYGDAWLALLRTDLPQDIYRKVRRVRVWGVGGVGSRTNGMGWKGWQ